MVALIGLAVAVAQAETPKIVHKEEILYVGIKHTVPIKEISDIAQEDFSKLFQFLGQHGASPAGAPFFRYLQIDMPKAITFEVAVPTSEPVDGDGEIAAGKIPAGDYISLTHFGPYSGLVKPNADLQVWAKDHKYKFKMFDTPKGPSFLGRLEVYKSNPMTEKDPNKLETELLYMIGG